MARTGELEKIQIAAYSKGINIGKDWLLSRKQIELVGKGNYVLDIGCNDGTLTEHIAKNNNVIGLELSAGAVKLARAKGLDVRKGNVYKLPFKNATFDAVHFSEVVEHLLNTDKALSEIHRVLKKGGRLVITTPNCASFRDRILVLCGHLQGYAQHTEHVRLFNLQRLAKSLAKNGFEIEKVCGSGFSFPFWHKRAFITYKLDDIIPPTLLQRLVLLARAA